MFLLPQPYVLFWAYLSVLRLCLKLGVSSSRFLLLIGTIVLLSVVSLISGRTFDCIPLCSCRSCNVFFVGLVFSRPTNLPLRIFASVILISYTIISLSKLIISLNTSSTTFPAFSCSICKDSR